LLMIRLCPKRQHAVIFIVYFSVPTCKLFATVQLVIKISFNHLTPNDPSMGRTAPLTSRPCILYIYSTNIRTEYFKHAANSTFFSLQNVVYFITLPFDSCFIHILNTGSAEIKRKFRRQSVNFIFPFVSRFLKFYLLFKLSD
jgi:hypothetical protein